MDALLGLREMRILPRDLQAHALKDATPLGVGVFKHFVALYYAYNGFFVAHCATLEGIEFEFVFEGGHEYRQMLEAIGLSGLPKNVRGLTKEETRMAQWEEADKEFGHLRKMSVQEIHDRFVADGHYHGYLTAKAEGRAMEFYRSLDHHKQTILQSEATSIGECGIFKHYSAYYYRFDDFYAASCTTNCGTDFHLAFRGGPAYEHMLTAVKPEELLR